MLWRLWCVGWLILGFGSPCFAVAAKVVPKASEPLRPAAWILIDAGSGAVLEEHEADTIYNSGALNPLMLMLLTLEQADLGLLPIGVPITVSPKAIDPSPWARKIPLRPDNVYELADLLKAIALSAADDVSVAVAEAIGGSIEGCIDLMNARAQRMGLTNTHYASIAGVSADILGPSEGDHTTARDLATLASALTRHSELLGWSSLSGVPFAGGVALRNANQLVGGVLGVDGMQVAVSRDHRGRGIGYEAVATALRGSLRLVAIVLGAPDNSTRYAKSAELLEWGYANYDSLEVMTQGERLAVAVDIPNGSVKQIQPVIGETAAFLRRHNAPVDFTCRLQMPATVAAPLMRDQVIGEMVIERGSEILSVVPLLSPKDVKSTSSFP